MQLTDLSLIIEKDKETLSFGDRAITLSIGDISLKLLLVPDYALQHSFQQFNKCMDTLSSAYSGNETRMLIRIKNKMKAYQLLVDTFTDEWSSFDQGIISDLLFVHPMAYLLNSYRIQYGYAPYSKEYGWQSKEEYERSTLLQKAIKKIAPQKCTNSEIAYHSLSFICGSLSCGYYSRSAEEDMDNDYSAAIEYIDLVMNTITDVQELKPKLAYFFNSRHNQIPNIDDCPDWMKTELTRRNTPYNLFTVPGLVAEEQLYLINKNQYIKICGICKKTFYSSYKSAKYCKTANPFYGNKTCQEIGQIQTPKSGYKLNPEYQNQLKKLSNWRRSQEEKHPEIFTTDVGNIILEEFNQCKHEWNSRANQALIDFENGTIDRETALDIFKCPDIEDRSPTLYRLLHK